MILFFLQSVATVFCLIFVIPVFAEMFADFGAELPYPTQVLIDSSEFMKSYMILGAPVIGGLGFAAVKLFEYLDKKDMKVVLVLFSMSPFPLICLGVMAMFLPIFQLSSVVG